MRGWFRDYGRILFSFVLFFYIFGAISSANARGGSLMSPLVALSQNPFGMNLEKATDPNHDTGSHKPADLPTNSPTPNAENKAAAAKNKNSVGSTPQVSTNITPGYIGVYSTSSPSDPASLSNLDAIASLGANVVYNYASADGNPQEITRYLDYANARGIKVIFSLKDYYDQLGPSNYRDYNGYLYGNNNEEFALGIVRSFANHPATWGFALTDERPEGPWDLGSWQGTLTDRYRKIKSLTNKPVMSVLVGHTSGDAGVRRNFLRELRGATDTFALDYYPIPYLSVDKISEIAGDLPAVGDNNGWFVAQTFSWASYPDTARGLDFNLGAARLPSSQEMVSMAALALNGGARNILFYSYFDIAGNGGQVNALRAAIQSLK